MTRRLRLQDPLLFVLALAATLIGVLFIFDAGYARALASGKGALPHEFTSQLIFLPIAVIAGAFMSRIRPDVWKKWAPLAWVGCLLLLIAVRYIGTEMNGAKRWLFGFQPAEFAKFATVLYLSSVFADRSDWPSKIKPSKDWAAWLDRVAVPKLIRGLPAIWVLVGIYYINKEPDLGTAFVVAVVAFALMAMGRVSAKSLLAVVVIGCGAVYMMIKAEPYRMDRLQNHTQRWTAQNIDDTAYQTVQSEYGMASGGLAGVGFGNGRAKHVMPAATTDFVLATVSEETGLLGTLGVLGLIGAIVWRLMWNAKRAPSEFGRLVLVGTAAWIGIQAAVNVMMANAFLPAIGIPLPFISSGGSSLLALWAAVGLCESVMMPQLAAVAVADEEGTDADSRHGRRDRRARLSGA